MKLFAMLSVGLLGLISSAPKPAPTSVVEVSGEYCEARTASVFAGACHYNGELVTSGRDAILAWNISHGTWKGVDLSGARAMAIVNSDQNLGDATAARSCELIVDSSATDAQAVAVADWLRAVDGSALGKVQTTKRAAILFNQQRSDFVVSTNGIASMMVHAMPNGECCTQPHLVWYTPLMPIQNRKVGFTESAQCIASTVGDPWDRSSENSAFYGTFSTSKETQVGVVSADR